MSIFHQVSHFNAKNFVCLHENFLLTAIEKMSAKKSIIFANIQTSLKLTAKTCLKEYLLLASSSHIDRSKLPRDTLR